MNNHLLLLTTIFITTSLHCMQPQLLTEQEWLSLSKSQRKKHITKIVDDLRKEIIISCARNNAFTTKKLDKRSQWKTVINTKGHCYNIPQHIIHNHRFIFNGTQTSRYPHINNVNSYQISPDKAYTASISSNYSNNDTVTLSTPNTIKHLNYLSPYTLFKNKPQSTKLCFSPQSTLLVIGRGIAINDPLTLWDLQTKECIHAFQGHKGERITAIEFNHCGDKMISISRYYQKNTVIIWDTHQPKNIQQYAQLLFPNTPVMSGIHFSPHDDRAIITVNNGDLIFLDSTLGKHIVTHSFEKKSDETEKIVTYPIFTPDNHFLITAHDNASSYVTLWNALNGDKLTDLTKTNRCTGIGLTKNQSSVISVTHNKQALITTLFDSKIAATLHSFQNNITLSESYALYCMHWAYRYNNSIIYDSPASLLSALKEKSIYCLLIKYFLPQQQNTTKVHLDDGSSYELNQHEIESSALLLQKQLLLKKITLQYLTKWGYDQYDHQCLQNMPIHLHNMHENSFILFRTALKISYDQFKNWFRSLTEKEQDDLLFTASYKGLGVPRLMAQLIDFFIIPDIIKEHISPHLLVKPIIKHLRDNIIIHNAHNKSFTHTRENLPSDKYTMLATDIGFMIMPKVVLNKNNHFLFNGHIDATPCDYLNNKKWLFIKEKQRSENITYLITPATDADEDEINVETSSLNSCLLWTIDKDHTVLNHRLIEPEGTIDLINFSPNGCYLAISTQANNEHPHNNLLLIQLTTQSDFFDHKNMFLGESDHISSLCFHPQSTMLATGSCDDTNVSTLSLWSTKDGTLLSSYSGNIGTIKKIQFNFTGTKIITASHFRDTFKIILWKIIDPSKLKPIIMHDTSYKIRSFRFSSDDKKIVALLKIAGNIIILNGKTGSILCKKTNNHQFKSHRSLLPPVFNHENRFFVSTAVPDDITKKGKVFLWDAHNNSLLSSLITDPAEIVGICGIGFSPDKRHIVITTTTQPDESDESEIYSIITVELFDKDTNNVLKWIKKDASLLQQYALYYAYTAHRKRVVSSYDKELLDYALESDRLPNKNIKTTIEKHL